MTIFAFPQKTLNKVFYALNVGSFISASNHAVRKTTKSAMFCILYISEKNRVRSSSK